MHSIQITTTSMIVISRDGRTTIKTKLLTLYLLLLFIFYQHFFTSAKKKEHFLYSILWHSITLVNIFVVS